MDISWTPWIRFNMKICDKVCQILPVLCDNFSMFPWMVTSDRIYCIRTQFCQHINKCVCQFVLWCLTIFQLYCGSQFIGGGNGGPGETTDLLQDTDKLYHIMYQVHLPWAWFELITSVVIGTDSIGSCKSNYHTTTTTSIMCCSMV